MADLMNLYIYIYQWDIRERKGKKYVWKSYTEIYGLCDAPLIWFKTIETFLLEFALVQLTTESSFFFLKCESGFDLIVVLYVDDILFPGKPAVMKLFTESIAAKFKSKTRTMAEKYIGISIEQTGAGILMHQETHIQKAVQKLGLDKATSVPTPFFSNTTSL